MGEHETIRIHTQGHVATIALHRPDRLNAFTRRMGAELFGAIADFDADPSVRAIVVTGTGRAFCAGADLEPGGATFTGGDWDESRVNEDRTKPWTLGTPVLAAVNGPAVGIGSTMMLPWDLRIASDRARFAFPFVRRGITPEAGSSWILPRLVGMSAAMDLMLTGRTIDAHEARAIGLVSRVVPHDELADTVQRIAHDLAVHAAPVPVALTKRLLWQQWTDDDPDHARAREDRVFDWAKVQPDAHEGVTSFLEKRDPKWPGVDLPVELLADD